MTNWLTAEIRDVDDMRHRSKLLLFKSPDLFQSAASDFEKRCIHTKVTKEIIMDSRGNE